MRYVRFGRTGVQVPAVSLGTWGHGGPRKSHEASVGWSGNDDNESRAALIEAFRLGINHWDTADVYGNGHAEELIGTVWDEVPRDEVFLATKIGWDEGKYENAYHPDHIRARIEQSLRNLKTDRIDLYYMHRCEFGPRDEFLEPAIETFRALRDAGKIRFIGLSDWESSKIMKYIDRVDPDVVQPYRNVVDDTYEESGLRSWIDDHDAGVAFFSPLQHGLLLGKYEEPVHFPEGDFRRNVAGFSDPLTIERMKVAKRAMEQRFQGQDEPVMHALVGALLTDAPTGCVLLGQRSPRHARAAAAVGEALSAEDARWVRQIYRGEA